MGAASETAEAVTPTTLIATFGVLAITYFISRIVYQLQFGPLSKIPGPRINALSWIPYSRHLLNGTHVQNTVELHKKYGEVVRIAPGEISFISAETAWPDIYGFRTGKMKGHLNMPKSIEWYKVPANGVPSLLTANDEDHSRSRKVLSHAFSEKALLEQEPLLQDYVDQLVSRLKETSLQTNTPVNVADWMNWTTFDIIADLMFGEPFGCLQDLATHKYVHLLLDAMMSNTLVQVLDYLPFLKFFAGFLFKSEIRQGRVAFMVWVKSQVEKRIKRGEDGQRPDFMTEILRHNGKIGAELSDKEIVSNAQLILAAGSETTATLLSGCAYLLTMNPEALNKLQSEIRPQFRSLDAITLEAIAKLPYLNAVLTEAMRVFPSVPAGFVRKVNKGGEFISGHFVPEGIDVSISQYAAYHSTTNFRDPDLFVPERWLNDARYADDSKFVLQPFNYGPRACLGRSLAWAEARLILAKLVYSFDMRIEAECHDWISRCRLRRLWDKPPLMITMTPVE